MAKKNKNVKVDAVVDTPVVTVADINTTAISRKSNIYNLANEMVELMDLLEDEELTEEEFESKMNAIAIQTDEEIEAVLETVGELEARGNAKVAYAKAAEEKIKKKKKTGESDLNKAKMLRTMVKKVLQLQERTKFEGAIYNCTIKATAPSLVYDDIKDIPAEFFDEQEPKLNTDRLKKFVKEAEANGEECEFAHLVYNTTLMVK